MKNSKWIGLFAVVLLVFSAFQPWVYIVSKNLTITGLNTESTNFGKPALMNLIMSGMAAICFIVPSVMAKRANLFFCAFNLAWSLRNFIIIALCRGGECPEKKTGIYLLMISSIIMTLAALLPDTKIKQEKD